MAGFEGPRSQVPGPRFEIPGRRLLVYAQFPGDASSVPTLEDQCLDCFAGAHAEVVHPPSRTQ
jgi:hypothetical protein